MSGWGDFFGRLLRKGQEPNGQGKLAPGTSGKPARADGVSAQRQLRSHEFYQPGDVIGGKYEIGRLVGKGGFGLIYAAYNRQTREGVALKTFRDEFLVDAHAREMFQKEALLWVNLEAHPFILAARWVQECAGRLFVEMDYVAPDGQGRVSLQDHLATCSLHLPWELTVEWANEFCLGMEHANAHGIKCHRDIKPANILITQDEILKISDFGLAAVNAGWRGGKSLVSRHADGRMGCSLLATDGKMWCGTPGYIAPEVYEGKGADVRSDIYSFGVVLWQMAANSAVPPFHVPMTHGENHEVYAQEYQEEVYRRQKAGRVPGVDGPLGAVIARCLRAEPQGRYGSFGQMQAELEEMLRQRTGRSGRTRDVGEMTAAGWSQKGANLHSLGQYAEAMACHDKALQIDLRCAGAWINKGATLDALGRYTEALTCFDEALKRDPRNAAAWSNKGNSLNSLGRYKEAIACFGQTLEIDPLEAAAWINMGNSLRSLGRDAEAVACCDKALQIDPRDATAWSNKGNSLDSLGRAVEAVACYDKALQIDPRDAATWYKKGYSLASLERNVEAITCYDKALEIDGRDVKAWSNKGYSLCCLGRLEEAVTCFGKALTIDSQHAASWYNKAMAEEKLGRRADAIRSYVSFTTVSPPPDAAQLQAAWQRLKELNGFARVVARK